MNKNAIKWVVALRSGKYIQCKETLQSDNSLFCCLGVASKVYENETGISLPKHNQRVYLIIEI